MVMQSKPRVFTSGARDLACSAIKLGQTAPLPRKLPIHEAQLLSYLRLAHKKVGLLINFHVPVLKSGLKRIVNEFPDARRQVAVSNEPE